MKKKFRTGECNVFPDVTLLVATGSAPSRRSAHAKKDTSILTSKNQADVYPSALEDAAVEPAKLLRGASAEKVMSWTKKAETVSQSAPVVVPTAGVWCPIVALATRGMS